MRADRLLSILLLLQVHRRMTAHELATRLEVSERTIYRDMEALSMAGVPVTAERGIGGGCMLLETFQTNLTGLNEAEVQTLFLSNPTRLLTDLGLHDAAEAALIKLFASLPSVSRRDAEYVRQRIYIDSAGWHSTQDTVPCLPVLQEAIWQERKLCFAYPKGNGTTERVVDPLGLVAKGSMWYLVAAVDTDIRSYRVSRIQEAHVIDQPCVRPESFELAAHWAQSSSQFIANLPRYPTTLRMTTDVIQHIDSVGRYVRVEQISAPDENGWATLNIVFETEIAACSYVLAFGTQIEVIAPQALREHVLCLAKSVVDFYHKAE
ncbi:MAG: YafY family protein [Ktedonobacteraceae bacterium]